MLSVCIPVFNFDVRKLVGDLLCQINKAGNGSEIIIIDDGSQDSFKHQYNELQNERTRIILLEKNIGRSRIRNCFIQPARFDNLLFLDCDSEIITAKFIENYFESIRQQTAVVCGGRIYSEVMENKNYALHWKYGRFRESKTIAERKLQPNRSFMTNNFMIRKETLMTIPFNDKLYGYGHEDTLFGFELMMAGTRIEHINNPVLHGSLATNKEFLKKTVSGLRNLLIILKAVNHDPKFINSVSLLKTFFKLKKYGLNSMLNFFSPFFSRIIYRILNSGVVNLRLFDFYKLLVFSTLYKKQREVNQSPSPNQEK